MDKLGADVSDGRALYPEQCLVLIVMVWVLTTQRLADNRRGSRRGNPFRSLRVEHHGPSFAVSVDADRSMQVIIARSV